MTRRHLSLTLLILVLAACGSTNTSDTLPTRFVLPDETSVEPTSVAQSGAATLPASWTPTRTPTLTETPSVTPSATITDTPTRTPTQTASPTQPPNPVNLLAQLALEATVLPTQFQVAPPIPGSTVIPPPGSVLATPLPATQCQFLPSGGFGQLIISQPDLPTQIGCPVGAPPVTVSLASAAQTFERGAMIWVSGSPSVIYVLFNNGTFLRFDDTFVAGVDPESGGQTPPSGLLEPVRGFGKVWRMSDAVRSGLGWATNPESASNATVQDFDRGRMLNLPSRGDIVILTYQTGPTAGLWRAVPGQF